MSDGKRMKKSKKLKKKRRANKLCIGIILCIILIIGSIIVLVLPSDFKFEFPKIDFSNIHLPHIAMLKEIDSPEDLANDDGMNVSINNKKETSEDKAREIAVAEFEKLGEKVSKDSLTVLNLERKDGLMYFYIKSEKNTCEVRKKDGVLTRLNANPVNQ